MTMPGGDGIGLKNLQLALSRFTGFHIDVGIATGGGNTTVNDTRKDWPVNVWAGGQIKIVKANGQEYDRAIASNTATQITFAALPGGIVVAAGDIYSVKTSFGVTDITDHAARLIRWGRDVAPTWVHAAEVVAPAPATPLVTQAVPALRTGYIYGFFISVGEANNFLINWVSAAAARSIRIPFTAAGALSYADFIPLNEGLPADAGTNITITNVNAGGAGIIYQARLLYAEV